MKLSEPVKPAQSVSTIVPSPRSPIDLEEVAVRVLASLSERRWAHLAHPIADAEFEALGRLLGTVELRTDLRVDPTRAADQRRALGVDAIGRPVLFEPDAMDFHTDRPSIQILAWRCVEQDAAAGENLWVDVHDIGNSFSPEEIAELGRVQVGYAVPDSSGRMVVHDNPLIEPGLDGPLVYWVPWRLRPPLDEWRTRLLERFIVYVRAKASSALQSLRLAPGECFFLDNRRTLHGRVALPPDSRRHLVRLYIRSEALASSRTLARQA